MPDQQVGQPEPLLQVDQQAAGSGTGWRRRAPRPARRARSAPARARAPARSRCAAAGRPRTRAGSGDTCSRRRPTSSISSATRRGPLGRRADAVDGERLADQPADGHPRVERHVRVLEDDLEAAAQRVAAPRRQAADVDAVEQDLARRSAGTGRRRRGRASTCRSRSRRRARASRPAGSSARRRRLRGRPRGGCRAGSIA